MYKLFIMIIMVLLLSGCETSSTEVKYDSMPPELSDCKTFYIRRGLNSITVMRCPGSTTSTTYSTGKTSNTTVTIDGITYIKESNGTKR